MFPGRFRHSNHCTLMRRMLALFCAISGVTALAQDSSQNLAAFKTPETAQTIRLNQLAGLDTAQMGFLGIETATNVDGGVIITAIAPNSPATQAGVQTKDVLTLFDGQAVVSTEQLRKSIESTPPGQRVVFSVVRGQQVLELRAKLTSLGAVGRPLDEIRLGIRVGDLLPGGGFPVEEVVTDSTGARAGLRTGDVLLKINDTRLDDAASLFNFLANAPTDIVAKLFLHRDDNEVQLETRLPSAAGPDRPPGVFGFRGGPGPRGFGNRAPRTALRLAIVGIEFPDVKHNPRITTNDWEQEFFSTNSFTGRNATGGQVHGSVNDFYREQSAGVMQVTGKILGWIEASKKRLDYLPPAGATAGRGDDGIAIGGQQWTDADAPLVNEVLDKLAALDGRDALSGYDGVVFLYAGGAASRDDSSVFWPHTTSMFYRYQRVRYVVTFEGGTRMADISVMCHEIGHVLGLPDLYVRQAQNRFANQSTNTGARGGIPRRDPNPYLETLADWDLMSVQAGYGRPQHLSAWSKEQLGWIKPAVIDPLVPQQLMLAPIENSSNECFKIPLGPDGSEYLLLENRRKIGFDQSVPAEGLLIWRVVYGRPVLEEAHGLAGANAARLDQRRIPYPTDWNNSFTPFSKPSSAAFTGNELPVYLTDIHRWPDGRITFNVGPRYD
jgi:M6 family metalloprotease-like protein